MPVNDTSQNGQSALRAQLEERRFWVWESAVRGFGLSRFLPQESELNAAGLRVWSVKEQQQRDTFAYSHLGERLQYRRPDTTLEKLQGFETALAEQRRTGKDPPSPPPGPIPKEQDGGLMRAISRLELASRFPGRTKELFGWDDQAMLTDEAEASFIFPDTGFSSQAAIKSGIIDLINRTQPPAADGSPGAPLSPKSAYWLQMSRDLAKDENPPLEHLSLMKDTADFGANYFLRLLYLFGTLSPTITGPDNRVMKARLARRNFDEQQASSEVMKSWLDGKPLKDLPPEQQAQMVARVTRFLTRLKDVQQADLRFSTAVEKIIEQALLRFKYWLDEPLICKDNAKLKQARAERKLPQDEEMTYWSENHYVLFSTAEYLAGQWWRDSLFIPGKDFQDPKNYQGAMAGAQRMARAKPRLLKWLNHRIMMGWSEWNAPGYYDEHGQALYNLVDFCLDDEIWTKANMALDLLVFDMARLNHRGSFGVTSGRAQSKFKVTGWEQSPGDLIEFLFHQRGAFAADPSNLAVIAASSAYEVPDALLEIGSFKADRVLVDRARVSTHFNEAGRYGIGSSGGKGWVAQLDDLNHRIALTHQNQYGQSDDDTVFWWGRAAYFAKQTVDDTVRLIEKYGLGSTGPFVAYDQLFGGGTNFGTGFGTIVGATLLQAPLAYGAGPVGGALGAAGGAYLGSKIGGMKGKMRPAIVGGRVGAMAAGLMALGIGGLLLSIPIFGWAFGSNKDLADDLSIFLEGSILSRASLYTWRDPGAMLSTVQDFRTPQLNFQSSCCHATLSMEASAWCTFPFSGALGFDADHNDGPGWWTGNWSNPRCVQYENAAILAFRPQGMQTKLYQNVSHAWFPREGFVEIADNVKSSNSDTEADGSWTFGKVVHSDGTEGYVGVYSARKDMKWLDKDSDFYKAWIQSESKDKINAALDNMHDDDNSVADRQQAGRDWEALVTRWSQGLAFDFFANKDWFAEDDNLWIIQVGSSHEFGTYQQFKSEVTGARIHIDFGDLECSYDIPGRGRLELHTDISDDEAREQGRFRFKGARIATDFYPRFESSFARGGRVEWGQPSFVIEWNRFNASYNLADGAEPQRVLNRTFEDGAAQKLKGLALRIRTEHENMDEDTVARATVKSGGHEIISRQQVANGEMEEHTDHDVEWMLFDEVAAGQPLSIAFEHVASSPSGDDTPHWRMTFELWALLGDDSMRPCTVNLTKSGIYETKKVPHLNFEDHNRTSGAIPISINPPGKS